MVTTHCSSTERNILKVQIVDVKSPKSIATSYFITQMQMVIGLHVTSCYPRVIELF
jgi:hypothetical protein